MTGIRDIADRVRARRVRARHHSSRPPEVDCIPDAIHGRAALYEPDVDTDGYIECELDYLVDLEAVR